MHCTLTVSLQKAVAFAAVTLCALAAAGPASAAALEDKYAALGGSAGVLGAPTSRVYGTLDGQARYQRYEWGAIYSHSVEGTYEIHGGIYAKWAAMGAERSPLGYPKSDELDAGDGRGRFSYFQAGVIAWTPQTGANAVYGGIGAKWLAAGGILGFGYPVTDELPTPDGRGRYNHFENGKSIYWTPQTGAHIIYGGIRGLWASMGWERSWLGYPVSDEMDVSGGGRINYFERGVIFWSPQSGARASR